MGLAFRPGITRIGPRVCSQPAAAPRAPLAIPVMDCTCPASFRLRICREFQGGEHRWCSLLGRRAGVEHFFEFDQFEQMAVVLVSSGCLFRGDEAVYREDADG